MVHDVRLRIPGESTVSGAKIIGNIVMVTGGTVDYTIGDWIAGADNSDGYVIVGDLVSSGLSGRPTGGDTGIAPMTGPTFWRSKFLTLESLTELANKLPGTPGDLTTLNAKEWILSAGSGQKYVITNDYNTGGGNYNTGDYKLSLSYAPAPNFGDITFPAHPLNGQNGYGNDDPNLVGTNDGVSSYQLYINTRDITGADQSTVLSNLVGNSGQITLTQNMDYVRYNFTEDAFKSDGYNGLIVYYDSQFNNSQSPLGSLSVDRGSESVFNTEDPIRISITIN